MKYSKAPDAGTQGRRQSATGHSHGVSNLVISSGLEPSREHQGDDLQFKYDDLLKTKYEDYCTSSSDDGCFGLVVEICRRLGKPLPDYRALAMDIANQEKIEHFRPVFEKVSFYEPGDLVLIRKMDMDGYHIGVIIEPGYFLEATRESGVKRIRLNHPLYKSRIDGIYRWNASL